MNIFALDMDPEKCAQMHCNTHTVKMITEYAQLMSTVCRLNGIDAGYNITHINHPCTKWVGASRENFMWLKDMSKHLNAEWQYRYMHTRNHKAYDVILSLPTPNLPDIGLTPFAQAMPDHFRSDNSVKSYRDYYKYGKKHLLKYNIRAKPSWL